MTRIAAQEPEEFDRRTDLFLQFVKERDPLVGSVMKHI